MEAEARAVRLAVQPTARAASAPGMEAEVRAARPAARAATVEATTARSKMKGGVRPLFYAHPSPHLMLPRRLAARSRIGRIWPLMKSSPPPPRMAVSTAVPLPQGKGASWAGLDSGLTNGVEPCTHYHICRCRQRGGGHWRREVVVARSWMPQPSHGDSKVVVARSWMSQPSHSDAEMYEYDDEAEEDYEEELRPAGGARVDPLPLQPSPRVRSLDLRPPSPFIYTEKEREQHRKRENMK
uniref:Uncharacterized protein n=1 Tax=Oryza meridionalis TaxID=40149 RepID=A0A0E0CX94_9ORYZ